MNKATSSQAISKLNLCRRLSRFDLSRENVLTESCILHVTVIYETFSDKKQRALRARCFLFTFPPSTTIVYVIILILIKSVRYFI